MAKHLEITVYDPETGEWQTGELKPGSYVLLTAEPCHRYATNASANGTVQITLKGVTDPMAGMLPRAEREAEHG